MFRWIAYFILLSSKQAGRSRNSLVLLGVTSLWQVALWLSRAPPHHTVPAFLNLNSNIFQKNPLLSANMLIWLRPTTSMDIFIANTTKSLKSKRRFLQGLKIIFFFNNTLILLLKKTMKYNPVHWNARRIQTTL